MNRNAGTVDRIVRVVAGLVILGLFFVAGEGYRWWALIGIVPLLTGLTGWCPAYLLFGIRTCEAKKR